LKADTDKDGKLSDEEYRDTKNGFLGVGEDLLSFSNGKINILASTESIEKAYVSPADEKQKKAQSVITMIIKLILLHPN